MYFVCTPMQRQPYIFTWFQDDIYSYFFQAYPVKQPMDPNSCHLHCSKVREDDPNEPFAPRIMESVHGYFQVWQEAEIISNKIFMLRYYI